MKIRAFTSFSIPLLCAFAMIALAGCPNPAGDPAPKTQTVSLGAQSGVITSGLSGSATYSVTTANVADATAGSIAWYSSILGTTAISAPAGVTASVSAVSANAATLTISATVSAAAGTYYFTLTEGSAVSAVATLVVNATAPTAVSFSGLSANGSSGSVSTTTLTLSFDVDPTSLTAANITVTGATKGALSGSGTTRTLAISAITVANGANVTVAIANPSGFTISPSSRTVAVNVAPTANEGSVASPIDLAVNASHTFIAGASGGGADTSYYKFTTTSGAGWYYLDMKSSSYYSVYLYSNASFSTTLPNNIDRTPDRLGTIFSGLSAGTTYYVKVQNLSATAISASGGIVDQATATAAAENEGSVASPAVLTMDAPSLRSKAGSHSYSQSSWYSFTTPASGDCQLYVGAFSGSLLNNTITLTVCSDAAISSVVATGYATIDNGGVLPLALTPSTTYYARIINSFYNSNILYDIKVSTLPTLAADAAWYAQTMGLTNVAWFVASVSAGTSYDIYLDDASGGSGTRTANVSMAVYQSNLSTTYMSGVDNAYATPQNFSVAAGQTKIYIKLGYQSAYGTFALKLNPH